MSLDDRLEVDIAQARGKRILDGDLATVFEIKTGFLATLRDRIGSRSTWDLVEQLNTRWPVAFAWMERSDDAARALGTPTFSNGDKGMWKLPDGRTLREQEELVALGGWALFFCTASEQPNKAPDQIPSDAPSLQQLLAAMKVRAAIVSWHDDKEWLLVVAK